MLRWLNASYLIEKLLPHEQNRKPLRRYFRWKRFRNQLFGRTLPDSAYAIASNMMDLVQFAEITNLEKVYSELQDYVLSGSGQIIDLDYFSEWLQKRTWYEHGLILD